MRLAGSLASLAGVALYNTCFKNVAIRDMLFWAMILGVTLGSTTLILIFHLNRDWGLSDQLFMLGDSVILTVLGQVCSGMEEGTLDMLLLVSLMHNTRGHLLCIGTPAI